MVRVRPGLFCACSLALAGSIPTPLLAQVTGASSVPPISSPQSQNPAGIAPPPARERDRDVFTPPPPGPCKIAQSNNATFLLKSVQIDGATGPAAKADLNRAYRSKIGQTISLMDVCAIRDSVQMILFRKDALARVDIPPQSLRDGVLTLHVTLARISSVIVKGDGGPAVAKVQDYLEHLRDKVFDIAAVQRYLYLASDLPGVHVTATLTPAPDAEGAVDLVVTVQTKAFSAEADVENYNSKALGRWGGLVRGDLSGLTPWGDRTSVVLYSTLFDDKQQVVQGIEEIRIGDEGLLGRLSFAYGESRPGADLKQLDLHGVSEVTEATLDYPIIRSRATDVTVSGGLDVVDQKTTVGGASVLSDDHLRILFAQLSGRQLWRRSLDFDSAVLSGFIEARQGLSSLGASHAGGAFLSRTEGVPDALVVKADASLTVQWNPVFATFFRGTGQYSNRVLLSYEDFAVGNLTIARGYDPSSLTGDKGVAGTIELRAWPAPLMQDSPFTRQLNQAQLYGFGFLDAAKVVNLSIGGIDRTVHSVGGGLDFGVTPVARMTVTYVHPMDRISPNAASRPSDRVMLNLSARF